MISTITLLTALMRGTTISLPLTDGHAMIKGQVVSAMREDGSGHSWIIGFARRSPYPNGQTKHLTIHVRTGMSYAARILPR